MMDYQLERIQYLTRKAQMGVVTPDEQNELAQLLGRDQQEFNNQNGLSVLIGIALAAIAAAIIIEILKGGRR
jgi:uncharacterized RmlC-like cupin family protein